MSIGIASLGILGSVMQKATAAGVQLPIEGELPSLGSVTAWLNSQPLTAAGLRGKVVLIDFCTYTCINWLRQLPYVRAWSEKYRDRGLVVIGRGMSVPFRVLIDGKLSRNSDRLSVCD